MEVTDCNKHNFFITPLMRCVQLRQPKAVSALLEKGVDANKGIGWYFNRQFIWQNTPLFYALTFDIIPLIDMLLEKGADPLLDSEKSKKLIANGVQHGGDFWLIPFTLALKKGVSMFNRILQYTNVFTEIGPDKRTSLCDAVELHFARGRDSFFDQKSFYNMQAKSFYCMQEIVAKGGVVCSGDTDSPSEELDMVSSRGVCSHIVRCLNKMLNVDDTIVGNIFLYPIEALRFVSLISVTDYMHENSCLYKTLAICTDIFKARQICFDLHELDDVSRERVEQKFEQRRQVLSWMTNITKHPSSLKHICRVFVRRHIRSLSKEAVQTLQLPDELINYVYNVKVYIYLCMYM